MAKKCIRDGNDFESLQAHRVYSGLWLDSLPGYVRLKGHHA